MTATLAYAHMKAADTWQQRKALTEARQHKLSLQPKADAALKRQRQHMFTVADNTSSNPTKS